MIYDELLKIGNFILNSFPHIWPYLLVTIPLAVAIQMSGASKYIKRVFAAKPLSAIILLLWWAPSVPFAPAGHPCGRVASYQRGASGISDVVLNCITFHGF